MTQKKILVVEDEKDIQELLRYNLVKEGYQAHCVGSGEAGLKEARQIFPNFSYLTIDDGSLNDTFDESRFRLQWDVSF
jgi:two-component system, OmpR family, alkaline phosphatase synthesis response regulator PhoP